MDSDSDDILARADAWLRCNAEGEPVRAPADLIGSLAAALREAQVACQRKDFHVSVSMSETCRERARAERAEAALADAERERDELYEKVVHGVPCEMCRRELAEARARIDELDRNWWQANHDIRAAEKDAAEARGLLVDVWKQLVPRIRKTPGGWSAEEVDLLHRVSVMFPEGIDWDAPTLAGRPAPACGCHEAEHGTMHCPEHEPRADPRPAPRYKCASCVDEEWLTDATPCPDCNPEGRRYRGNDRCEGRTHVGWPCDCGAIGPARADPRPEEPSDDV